MTKYFKITMENINIWPNLRIFYRKQRRANVSSNRAITRDRLARRKIGKGDEVMKGLRGNI